MKPSGPIARMKPQEFLTKHGFASKAEFFSALKTMPKNKKSRLNKAYNKLIRIQKRQQFAIQKRILLQKAKKSNQLPYIPNPEEHRMNEQVFYKKHRCLVSETELVVISSKSFPVHSLNKEHRQEILDSFHRLCQMNWKKKVPLCGLYLLSGIIVAVCEISVVSAFKEFANNRLVFKDRTEVEIHTSDFLERNYVIKILFSGEPAPQEQVIKKISIQNPALNISDWALISRKVDNLNRLQCTFKIPPVDFIVLGLMKFSVCYNLDALSVIFVLNNRRSKHQNDCNLPLSRNESYNSENYYWKRPEFSERYSSQNY